MSPPGFAEVLIGREKEARGRTSEASADQSDFPGKNPVSVPLAGKNLHLVISQSVRSSRFSLI
jgi:hypothetical protein